MSRLNLTLVVFQLNDELFCIPSDIVTEVLPMLPLRQLPGAPSSIAGVARVRDRLLPILDPRPRLHLAPRGLSVDQQIVSVASGEQRLGLIVDSVEDVVSVPPNDICEAGKLERQVPYGIGLVRHGAKDMLLVDLEALILQAEWKVVSDAVASLG
ncbi:MAG: chemotaxis protein CheW [Myxococcales bacterium]